MKKTSRIMNAAYIGRGLSAWCASLKFSACRCQNQQEKIMGKLLFSGKIMQGQAQPLSTELLSERETLDLMAETRDPRTYRACLTICQLRRELAKYEEAK